MKYIPTAMVLEAEQRIRPYIRQTHLEHSPYYSQKIGAQVYFKCENLQHTGSFKVRGALNKILSLSQREREKGIVTASTGNHGAACAFAIQKLGGQALVFVPESASEAKVTAVRRLGAKIFTFGQDSAETERHARQWAKENGVVYVPPYNDPLVVSGQGTIGIELLHQMPEIDVVFVSVGGGGLIGGIASTLKSIKPAIQVVGCSAENSQVMALSVAAGELGDFPSLPTLSDGTAGGLEPETMTFPLCQTYVDRYISVSEAEISESLCEFMAAQHLLIEGSAALAVAALQKAADDYQGKHTAVVLCGANISLERLRQVLNETLS